MRIPDDLLNVAIFLGGRDAGGQLHYRATAFCVAMPSARHRLSSPCLVTAKHNVINAMETYGNVYIRMNAAEGGSIDVAITDPWTYADAAGSDIAAVPFPAFLDDPGLTLPVPASWLVTSDVIEARKIGPGEQLVVMGLFANHIGKQRNLPIVRSGNLASMPVEPLVDPMTAAQYDAFLAEVRSIGGLSGSPVFVALVPSMRVRLDGAREADDGQHFYLLGLIRGHWRQSAEADFAADSVDEAEFQHLNTGIAIVTPIEELLPIFETERFVQYRAEMERRLDARSPGLQPSE